MTWYIHMKNIPVVEGQTVNAGQIIGYQSNAGVDATHLHFEIRPAGSTGPAGSSRNPRNPLTTIRPYDTWLANNGNGNCIGQFPFLIF